LSTQDIENIELTKIGTIIVFNKSEYSLYLAHIQSSEPALSKTATTGFKKTSAWSVLPETPNASSTIFPFIWQALGYVSSKEFLL